MSEMFFFAVEHSKVYKPNFGYFDWLIYQIFKNLAIIVIRWRSISMRAGPAFFQFDWSKAGLSMDLPVFVYSHTKTGFKFFQYREDIWSFLCAWGSLPSNHAERTSQGSCFG